MADTEKLLQYIDRIEEGELACIAPAEKLAKEQGLNVRHLQEAIRTGVDKKVTLFLQKIKEKSEDIEVYTKLIEALAREYNLDLAELEKGIKEAAKEAEVRKLNYYINMIENENIHLIGKAKAIQKKYGIESGILDEAIRRGEYAYLLRSVKQIKKGPHFHPLLPREERILRSLAKKHGHEIELEGAIECWRTLSCQSKP